MRHVSIGAVGEAYVCRMSSSWEPGGRSLMQHSSFRVTRSGTCTDGSLFFNLEGLRCCVCCSGNGDSEWTLDINSCA